MSESNSPILPNLDSNRNAFGLPLSHGAGAPLFEQRGPQTRIYRAPIRAFGKIIAGDKIRYGLLLNISTDGCLLKTEATFTIGTAIEISISHPEQGTGVTTVAGTIIRQTTIDGRVAYGVSFSQEADNKRAASGLYAMAATPGVMVA